MNAKRQPQLPFFFGLLPLPVGEGWDEGISPHGLLTVFLDLLDDVGG